MNGADCGKCGYITCRCDENEKTEIEQLKEQIEAKDEAIEAALTCWRNKRLCDACIKRLSQALKGGD